MATLTLLQLRTAVRQRADQENSLFITDAELNSYINQSYQELYDLLVQKYGDDYFVAAPYTLTTTGTDATYALPSTFQKLLGVDLGTMTQGSGPITLRPFMFQERNQNWAPNYIGTYGATNLRYRLRANTIWFTPTPQSGQLITIYYVPQLTALAADADTADNLGGWLEYVICDAAIKCMQKEESDCSILFAQKQALIARIEAAAENRDAGNPQTVQDSRNADGWWPGDSGGWGSMG